MQEAKKRKKPSFLSFDEGSILVQHASEDSLYESKHYQEALDTLKRYVGNERGLVIGVSTNMLKKSFENALTREGRLTPFFIGLPDTEQRKSMWKYFADAYKIMNLTDEQSYALAETTPAEQGAFIEEFCRTYRRVRRSAILKKRGYESLVEALKDKVNVSEGYLTRTITFTNLYQDLTAALQTKYERLKADQGEPCVPRRIGF